MSSANGLFILMMGLGPLLTISSDNWIICWAGVELSFLGTIPMLFVSNKFSAMNKESSLKYFCVQALGSALLFICGLVIFSSFSGNFSTWLGLILGLCIKLGIFPGHFWVPSVIAGLEWFPCFLILSVQKVAPLALLIKCFESFDTNFQYLMFCLGAISSVVGGFIGNNQTSIRAMIGASSITHGGWLVVGAGVGSAWLYFGVYSLVLGLTFDYLSRQSGGMTCLGLLSLSGLPPFIMFVGKWSIVMAGVQSGVPYLMLGFLLLGAFLSLIYYLKFSYSLYLSDKEKLDPLSLNRDSIMGFLAMNLIGVVLLVLL